MLQEYILIWISRAFLSPAFKLRSRERGSAMGPVHNCPASRLTLQLNEHCAAGGGGDCERGSRPAQPRLRQAARHKQDGPGFGVGAVVRCLQHPPPCHPAFPGSPQEFPPLSDACGRKKPCSWDKHRKEQFQPEGVSPRRCLCRKISSDYYDNYHDVFPQEMPRRASCRGLE